MTDQTTETARALLYRHGLPEDVIDGALCLHAQELAAVQRRDAAVWGVDTAAGKHVLATADLIDPTRGATPVVPLPSAGQTALRDRIAAAIADALKPRYGGPQHNTPGGLPLTATAEEIRLHRAQPLADAVLAVLPATVDRAALVRACASFVRDTYSGEWADDAAATLETDADKIERGEPCSLLRLAAVLPATTNHDTDTSGVELRGDTEIRVAVLREAADAVAALDRRKVGITADTIRDAWEEGRDEGADLLRRMADETPATETCPTPETHNWGCGCPSDEHPSALGTLPAWLHQRFDPRGPDWEQLDEDDRSYWAHQARAVRRAVARGGFKQPAAGARQDGTQK